MISQYWTRSSTSYLSLASVRGNKLVDGRVRGDGLAGSGHVHSTLHKRRRLSALQVEHVGLGLAHLQHHLVSADCADALGTGDKWLAHHGAVGLGFTAAAGPNRAAGHGIVRHLPPGHLIQARTRSCEQASIGGRGGVTG